MAIRRRKRTKISVETRELIVLHGQATRIRAHCPQCRQQVSWLTPALAGLLAGVTSRTVYRWVEAGQVHFEEDKTGEIRVCASSVGFKQNDESRR